MRFGFKSACNSVGSGFTGVITKPMEGRKKSGMLGFIKGTAKGVTGLVVKPMSGALDFFSMTTEGLKNTTKKMEELEMDKRMRLPRPFYEKEKIIREYDEFHAFWVNLVPRIKQDINCDSFFDACLLNCEKTQWQVLFLTLHNLVMIVPVVEPG